MIKDSGNRFQFETGAVRDVQEFKGRCDLLPLDVVSECMNDIVLSHLDDFKKMGDPWILCVVLSVFAENSNFKDMPTMFLEVSKHFEEGCKKYGENNWQKGLPVSSYINSGTRHYLKWIRGDKDENHDLAFVWNITCAVWTCKNKPELNNYARSKKN